MESPKTTRTRQHSHCTALSPAVWPVYPHSQKWTENQFGVLTKILITEKEGRKLVRVVSSNDVSMFTCLQMGKLQFAAH